MRLAAVLASVLLLRAAAAESETGRSAERTGPGASNVDDEDDDDAAGRTRGGRTRSTGSATVEDLDRANAAAGHEDAVENSFFDPLSKDPSCATDSEDCYEPPASTVETETVIDATCLQGAAEELNEAAAGNEDGTCKDGTKKVISDKHWESNARVKAIRDKLLKAGSGASYLDKSSSSSEGTNKPRQSVRENKRPPIFLMPGLASTRLVAWKHKKCTGAFSSDIKVQDNVWLNLQLILQMGTVNVECMKECMQLGRNQTDMDDLATGCKLRADEGLDAIASLAPGGIGSSLLVGGTNTVYAWLIQWLADNLGYDVGNIVGLPYDWRLTPDRMESRDGFMTLTRKRIEAAVAMNGQPGIMVAHSMGNLIFRYFLAWLRIQMRKEIYTESIRRMERRERKRRRRDKIEDPVVHSRQANETAAGWLGGFVPSFDHFLNMMTAQPASSNDDKTAELNEEAARAKLWELACIEGDQRWIEWLEDHVWTYVGLSAPMLGAVNPLRSVISGENMGLPISDDVAREIEITFGSTHTVNPVSTKTGFCDDWDASSADSWQKEADTSDDLSFTQKYGQPLACLDDIANDIEMSSPSRDPWKNFPALRMLLRDRADWDSDKPMIDIESVRCPPKGSKAPCIRTDVVHLSPEDAQSGKVFSVFNEMWPEEGDPLAVKREQLEESFWNDEVPNILNQTWDRPLIKHVIMAYGVDVPTEIGYVYVKQTREMGDNVTNATAEATVEQTVVNSRVSHPTLKTVLWEGENGKLSMEYADAQRGSITDVVMKRKPRREPFGSAEMNLPRSGDGSVPYLSLAWAHTWLLHAARAKRISMSTNLQVDRKSALDYITISYRPKGATDWINGPMQPKDTVVDERPKDVGADTGTMHPHGTKYKPEMVRYHNVGMSRTTGDMYTTTVLEAIGVEHKETTRNYDILAAVFTEVLEYMYDDLEMMSEDGETS